MRILIDPQALAACGNSVDHRRQERASPTIAIDVPAGDLTDRNRSLLVHADASVTTPSDIADDQHQQDRPRSATSPTCSSARLTSTSSIRVNGQTGIGLSIIRQAQSNTLDISQGVRAAVAEMNTSLPPGVTSASRRTTPPSSAARSRKCW